MSARLRHWLSIGVVTVAAIPLLISQQSALAARPGAGTGTGTAHRSSGPLLAWGDDQDGELGDGSVMDEPAPVAVNPPAELTVTSARVGSFAIAVTTSGAVWTWGRGQQGELGNGATKTRRRPVKVKLPVGVRVRSVRAGFEFALAVTTTGRVLAWGDGIGGELGDGRGKSSDVPVWVDLPTGVKVTAVSAGGDSAVALTSTGQVLAWGDNLSGQLGDGSKANSARPVWVKLPKGVKVTAIGSGVDHTLAVTSTGGLLAWGDNSVGDLGDGTTKVRRVPVRVRLPAGVKVTSAFGGLLHSLALTTDGRVLAWGDNKAGQLGDGSFNDSKLPVWVRIPKADRIVALAAGRYHSLALTQAGKVLAWGFNGQGQLGDGTSLNRDVPVPIKVPGRVISIGAGCEAYASLAVVTKIVG